MNDITAAVILAEIRPNTRDTGTPTTDWACRREKRKRGRDKRKVAMYSCWAVEKWYEKKYLDRREKYAVLGGE
jgi:hypothetical protein